MSKKNGIRKHTYRNMEVFLEKEPNNMMAQAQPKLCKVPS